MRNLPHSRKFIKVISFLLLSTIIFTCSIEEDINVKPEIEQATGKIPFSPENMLQAIKNLASLSNGKINVVTPSTTHNYVRFEPQNLDQIFLLDDLGYDLWDTPLDQEIEYEGEYYQHPGLPDSLNYFYTLIPVNYVITEAVPHTIISQVVLFDEDAGDEVDPEDVEDPWIPEPCTPVCDDPTIDCVPCSGNGRVSSQNRPEDLLKKTTKQLLGNNIDLKALYTEAMRLAGHLDEIDDASTSGRTQGTRYYPAGTIKVRDNSTNVDVPVKDLYVKARRFFKMKSTQTNSSGYFSINKGFRKKARIILKFKNDYTKVRGINGSLKVWQYAWALRKKMSLYERSEMQNIAYTFNYQSDIDSWSALQFAGAHCLNTLQETRQNCTNNNINLPPSDLNIWITPNVTDEASAPMLRSIANTSLLSAALTYMFPGSGSGAFKVLRRYVPDVTLNIKNSSGNTRSASDISQTFAHEFGHASHYSKVGNTFWQNLITAIVSNGGYGTKTSSGAGHIAVAESWGYFIGPTFNRIKYSSNATIAKAELDFLEYQRRDDTKPTVDFNGSYSRGWIPWGIYHDLIDTSEPSITLITDQVSGYTINGIFKGLGSSSTTVQNLKSSILSNNGNSQSTQVNTLVTGYGW